MAVLPDITSLDIALMKLDATMGASEAHGALCGMLCATGLSSMKQWKQHVIGVGETPIEISDEINEPLMTLHQSTVEQINDVVTDFCLLLPDDNQPLHERVDSLASWCQGYVYGLAAGGINNDSDLPDDSSEILKDFIEISRAGHENTEEEENEDEIAYMEVMEFVRMGVLLINEELQPLKSPTTIQ